MDDFTDYFFLEQCEKLFSKKGIKYRKNTVKYVRQTKIIKVF